VTSQACVDGRQARQQHPPRLGFVAREGECAFQHVAGRQHAQLISQLPRAPATVEHCHDGVEPEPRICFQAAEKAWQPCAAAKAADVELAKSHGAILSSSQLSVFSFQF
jgi:hypothetical protein